MRLSHALNRHERLRRRAIASGELIDVTSEARELELHARNVCVSKRLWKSLIHPYPFARPDDCLPLATLLYLLRIHLATSRSARSSCLLVLPSQLPDWCRGGCYLKVFINSPTRSFRSIIVQPYSDPIPFCRHRLEDSLPPTLLVRLAEVLRTLMIVARTAEQGLVDSMRSIATQLIEENPLRFHIEEYLATMPLDVSLPFPPDDYRAVLFADVDELLAIASQCADLRTRPRIAALKSHYRTLLSPLASFCQILEDLLRFAASCANFQGPLQTQAFAQLLNIYADVNARLQRLETEVPRDALALVRFQIRLLAQVVVAPHVKYLADIEHACASLISDRWSHTRTDSRIPPTSCLALALLG